MSESRTMSDDFPKGLPPLSELGTCDMHNPRIEHEENSVCVNWTPLLAKPIPPLLLQAYRALRDSRNYTPGPSVGEAIAAIEAEYPEAK